MSQISINPVLTTNAPGSFLVTEDGLIQGTALNDPAIRNQLAGGVLASAETLPMWGGVAIFEDIPVPATRVGALGGNVGRALTNAAITGFSVFDQNHSMVNTPQSQVPLAVSGMGVNFYRLGSGARIAVAIDPALVSLEGGLITQQVSWDFNLQRLVPYQAANNAIAITSQTWSAGIVTVVTGSAHPFAVGNDVTIGGAVPSPYNGDVTILTSADNTHFTYALAADPGTSPASTPGTVAAGGGALACKVIDIQVGNCMTVTYDPVTGFANWNRNGSAAVILI